LGRKGLREDIRKFRSVLNKVDIEMMLLLAGRKEVMKKEVKSGGLQLIKRCEEFGLYVSKFDLSVAERLSFSRQDFGRKLKPFIIVGKEKEKVEEAFELSVVEMKLREEPEKRRNARHRLGRLLCYPPCCVGFYVDVDPRDDEEAFYAGWRGTDGEIYGECIATGFRALTVLSHAPCSLSCEESRRLARKTLEMISSIEPEAREVFEKLSKDATLYFGDKRRFILRGERLDTNSFGYEEVCAGHLIGRNDATDQTFFQCLMEGDRIYADEQRFAIMKGRRVLLEISLLDRVRKPLLLVPGERTSLKRVRVLCIETPKGGERDLFGNMRLSLLVGDLKVLGHIVRCFTVTLRGGDERAHLERFGAEVGSFAPDVVFFYRVCEKEILETVRRNAPKARLFLFEGNDFYGRPSYLELVPFGRLHPLWLVEKISTGKSLPEPKEPPLYAPEDDAFSPEMQRQLFGEPKETRTHIEVLGRHGCPYQKPLKRNPLFQDIALPPNSFSYGCSMCTFRAGKWAHCPADKWVDSIMRQILWFKETLKDVKTIRIVDHFGTQFLEELLLAFLGKRVIGLCLMLDARPEHILSRSKDFDRIAMLARKTRTKIDFACIGFENFSQQELDRLNKGITVRKNEACARILKRLWQAYRDVFVNYSRGCGFILFTPWTTLEDLRQNVAYCRELDFSLFRDEFSITKLRLYKEMPLYYLALKDDLLKGSEEAEPVHGYAPDFPWIFRSKHVERVYKLLIKLRDLGALKGKEIQALEVALLQVEKKRCPDESFCKDPSGLLKNLESKGSPWFMKPLKGVTVEDAFLETDGKKLWLWVKTDQDEKVLGTKQMDMLPRFAEVSWIRLGEDGQLVEVPIVTEKADKNEKTAGRGYGIVVRVDGNIRGYRWFALDPMNPYLVAGVLGNGLLQDVLCSSRKVRYLHYEKDEGAFEFSLFPEDMVERINSHKKSPISRLLTHLKKTFGRFQIVRMCFRTKKGHIIEDNLVRIGFVL
jgi:hypothetical protein